MDVRLTSGGIPGLLHDESLSRTTGNPHRVSELSLTEIKKLDAGSTNSMKLMGEKIPTLEEALLFARGKLTMLLHIEGDAVFLAGSRSFVPVALAKNVKHNHVAHNRTILLHFQAEDVPRVPSLEKVQTEKLGGGFYRVVARYGFMEYPSLERAFSLARMQGVDLNPATTSFYIGRENLIMAEPSSMARWRASLFMFMSRNAADATSFFRVPAEQVIEIDVRLAI